MKTILLSSLSYDGSYGGVENSLRYLSLAYKARGYKVVVFASESINNKFVRSIEVEPGIEMVKFRRFFSRNKLINYLASPIMILDIIFSLLYIKHKHKVFKSICRNQFVCLFVNLFYRRVNLYLAPGFSHRQSSGSNMTSDCLSLRIRRYIHSFFDFMAIRFSSSTAVFSKNMLMQAGELARCFPIGSRLGGIELVKPGVDKGVFYRLDPRLKKSVRTKLNLPDKKLVLLCVGRFVKAKGFDLAIKSVANSNNVHLVLVGDGPELGNLKEMVSMLNIFDKVTFCGVRSNVSEYYQASDYFFMSSRYEPLGQTILEAISCSLPIIAFKSNVMTATDEILGDKGVIYIDSLDEITMQEVIGKLPKVSDSMYGCLSEQARFVSFNYEWDSLAMQLIQ